MQLLWSEMRCNNFLYFSPSAVSPHNIVKNTATFRRVHPLFLPFLIIVNLIKYSKIVELLIRQHRNISFHFTWTQKKDWLYRMINDTYAYLSNVSKRRSATIFADSLWFKWTNMSFCASMYTSNTNFLTSWVLRRSSFTDDLNPKASITWKTWTNLT